MTNLPDISRDAEASRRQPGSRQINDGFGSFTERNRRSLDKPPSFTDRPVAKGIEFKHARTREQVLMQQKSLPRGANGLPMLRDGPATPLGAVPEECGERFLDGQETKRVFVDRLSDADQEKLRDARRRLDAMCMDR